MGIREHQSVVIPGLLQTAEYTRVLLRASTKFSDEEIEKYVAARMARQAILSRRNPPSCTFYIDEYALRRSGPGAEVMMEQLRHLNWLARRPHICLRIIPGSRFHAGTTGAFRLIEFETMNPLVWLESAVSLLFIEQDAEVKIYQDTLVELDSVALTAEESQALILEWIVS